MAKEEKDIKEEKVNVGLEDKSATPEANSAPNTEKPEDSKAPDTKDFNDALMILNIMDKEIGGTGEITEIPESMRGSIKYIIEKLIFIRDLFEDPTWKAILDDLADQKEDGKTPSVEVAIARNIPMEKLLDLAENEDYEGAQSELTDRMASQKQTEEEDAIYDANFQQSQKAGQEYAAEMGYDEDRTNALFQAVLDLLKVTADGILTKEEFAKVDKMLNYDADTESLQAQINTQDAKEILPDKASVDASLSAKPRPASNTNVNTPGLGSMDAYSNTGTDVTKIGSRKRKA